MIKEELVLPEEIGGESTSDSPTPIEEREYLNYYQYLRGRLIESYGEELVTRYESFPVISLGLSILVDEKTTDGFIIRALNHANIELLKELLIQDTINDGRLSEKPIVDYYAVLKNDPSESICQEDAIKYAEEMVADFYNFLFNEIMGGRRDA